MANVTELNRKPDILANAIDAEAVSANAASVESEPTENTDVARLEDLDTVETDTDIDLIRVESTNYLPDVRDEPAIAHIADEDTYAGVYENE